MTPEKTPDAPRAPQARSGYVDPDTFAELQRLARSRPRSGRQAAAKASAIRTLERLERSRSQPETPMSEAAARLFNESRDPDERVQADDWFPDRLSPELRELYAVETVAARRRWYTALEERGRL